MARDVNNRTTFINPLSIPYSLFPMNPVDYLRISLIDRCNFRCQYCMPEGEELAYVRRQDWLTIAELLILLEQVFIPLGFRKFRLTGGGAVAAA